MSSRTTKKAIELQGRVVEQMVQLQKTQGEQLSLINTSGLPPVQAGPKELPPPVAAAADAPVLARTTAPSAAPASSPASLPHMPPHEAERILSVRNDALWASVESARATRVSKSSPEFTGGLSPQETATLLEAARQANAAYLTLAALRKLRFPS
ncbi:hypothetical protein LC612_35250 [Nostoc sp. CHAB 5834]|nr:hypothetical protein [Nostoc sp. CHAB 5834]